MKLYLVVGHIQGYYEDDYNLIAVCDSNETAKRIAETDTDFESYEIQTCNLNERIV